MEKLKIGEMVATTAKELVDVLTTTFDSQKKNESGQNYHPSYYYYTTLSTFAKMLNNRKLRLSDITSKRINDQREPYEFGEKDVWRRTRIGCFSVDRMENNAMWGLYGKPEDEAILIRIPSKTMECLSNGKVSVVSRDYDLDGTRDRFKFETVDVERYHHDVAYFANSRYPTDDEYDEDEVATAELPLFRDYKQVASVSFDTLERLDPLIGYIKRWQWMYECESRLRVVLDDKYTDCDAYIDLPEDFFAKVGIILGPHFNVYSDFASEVLCKFLHERGKKGEDHPPIHKSAYGGVLNYDKKDIRGAVDRSRLKYEGKIVGVESPQAQSLYERHLRYRH